MGMHMDLDGRHAAVLISIPEWLRKTFSSNPEESRRRREARAARNAATATAEPSAPRDQVAPQPQATWSDAPVTPGPATDQASASWTTAQDTQPPASSNQGWVDVPTSGSDHPG
jgi:hypothetical protein